jgi:hypothetical protein
MQVGGLQDHRAVLAEIGRRTHVANQLQHGRHVLQARDVLQRHRFGGEQRGAQFRQGGVLGAGNADFAAQRPSAANQELVHGVFSEEGLPTRRA